MRRLRPPDWYLKGNVHKSFKRWYPWALGIGLGTMYYYAPEPLDDLRSTCLATFRRPLLRTYEWIEVRDVDPETLALELPPEQIFGPLPLHQQMRFLLEALRQDNELADAYVTRIIVDRMDLSLDPPLNGDLLVDSGGRELIDFAVDDFLETRPNRRHKFFPGDQFLRVLNLCCGHYQLVEHLITKHDGVGLVFKALDEAENEYARVLATRVLTLFAFLQPRDGVVEERILNGGYLGELVEAYRQSSGDPTDTRFSSLLLSSILRIYPRKAYEEAISENLVQAAVSNLNISRYKGLPQHLRIIFDLERLRSVALPTVREKRPAKDPKDAHNSVERLEEKVRKNWNDQAKEQRWLGLIRKYKDSKEKPLDALLEGMDPADKPVAMGGGKLAAREKAAAEQAPLAQDKDNLAPALLAPRPPPPMDLRWSVAQLLFNAEFIPIAFGVIDQHPEYYEAVRDIMKLTAKVAPFAGPVDLLENRVFNVSAKIVERFENDPSFEEDGTAQIVEDLCQSVFHNPACAPAVAKDSKEMTWELKEATRIVREWMDRRQHRFEEVAREEQTPQGRGGRFMQRDLSVRAAV